MGADSSQPIAALAPLGNDDLRGNKEFFRNLFHQKEVLPDPNSSNIQILSQYYILKACSGLKFICCL